MIIYDIKPPKKIRTKQTLRPKISESGFVPIPKIYKSVFHRSFSFLLIFVLIFGNFLFGIKLAGAVGTTYYVDNCDVTGNDTNNGTSVSTPWLTINKVNTSSFVEGDTISFRKGCTWREQLTVPSSGSAGNPITFGAYGETGARPIISGANVVGSWTADISSYSETFNMDNWGCWGNYTTTETTAGRTYRTRFIQSVASGSSIRVTVKAGAGASAVISGASVGTSSGGRTEASPTRITWDGGNNGTTVSAGATKVSDPITFTWSTSSQNAVSIYVSSGTLVRYDSTVPGYNYLYLNNDNTDQTMTAGDLPGTGELINDSAILKVEVSSGLANVWNATVAATPKQVFKDGVLATKGASKAALTQGRWYASGTALSYYESVGNPGSQAYTLEASVRDYGIYFNAQNKVTIDNFNVVKTNKYGINIGHDSSHTLDNAIVQNSLVQYSYDAGIFSWVPTSLAGPWGVQILNNESSYNGIQANTDSASSAPAGIEIVGSNATYGTLVQGNNVHDNAWGMELDQGTENTTVIQNSIHDNLAMGLNIDRSDNNKVYNNIIYNHPNWGLRIWSATHSTVTGNIVYNNTFYNNQTGIVVEDEQTNLKIKNNIISTNTQTASTEEINMQSGKTYSGLDVDYNIYYRPSGTTYWKYGATNYSFANWKANTNQDSHSINSDPLFTNAGAGDLTLLTTSPAIDSGVSLGDTYKLGLNPNSVWPSGVNTLNQNTNGIGWDIGAYVFTETTAPTLRTNSSENTFNEDTRCLATTPLVPQWASRFSANGGVNLLWSAMGGTQVDIEITNDKGEYVYKYVKVPNTGHMFLPNVTSDQAIRIRVFNECEYGEWLIVSNNAPSLPNTGFAPYNNNIPWYIPVSLSLIQKLIGLM